MFGGEKYPKIALFLGSDHYLEHPGGREKLEVDSIEVHNPHHWKSQKFMALTIGEKVYDPPH